MGSNTTMSETVVSAISSVMENVTPTVYEDTNEPTPIFLQTRAAQGISGAFVWLALFLTCQQVI